MMTGNETEVRNSPCRIAVPHGQLRSAKKHRSDQGRTLMKKITLLASVLGLWPTLGLGQTMEELVNDGKNTDNVLNHSMGLDRKSYSPLKQINKSNIKRLVPIWSTSLMNDWGELAAPTVYNGVIYAINGNWTFAIDVETGKQIWRTAVTPSRR
jgi:alcohol dehydrogenase (cytochrome c)